MKKLKLNRKRVIGISMTAVMTLTAVFFSGAAAAAPKPREYEARAAEQIITVTNDADSGLFLNAPIKGTVQLTKVDAEYPDHKLAGAEFAVYVDVNENGKYDPQIDSEYDRSPEEKDGVYTLSDLRYGKYLIKETKAPEGFYADPEYHAFSVTENGKTVIVENEAGIGFVNEPIKGTVRLIKADSENVGSLLSGAEFTVYLDADGDGKYTAAADSVAGVMTENEKGHYELKGLRYGKYLIKETKAPRGFIADSKYYAFSVTGENVILK